VSAGSFVRDVLGFDLVVDFVRSGEGTVVGMTLDSGRVNAIRFTKRGAGATTDEVLGDR
jgi:hypothetical protein